MLSLFRDTICVQFFYVRREPSQKAKKEHKKSFLTQIFEGISTTPHELHNDRETNVNLGENFFMNFIEGTALLLKD